MKRILFIILLLFLVSTAHTFEGFKPCIGRQVDLSHPLSKGLVGCWLFNEGGGNAVFDLSGNNNALTLAGDTSWVCEHYGNCLRFDGNGDYAAGASLGELELPLTIVSRLYFTTQGVNRPIFLSHDVDDVFYGVSLEISSTQVASALLGDGDGNEWNDRCTRTGATSLSRWVWYDVAAVFKSQTDIDVYVNGVNDNGAISSNGGAIDTSVGLPKIGGSLANDTDRYHLGDISYVSLYKRALTADEIAQLYREPFCMFEPTFDFLLYGAISAPPATAGQVITVIMN